VSFIHSDDQKLASCSSEQCDWGFPFKVAKIFMLNKNALLRENTNCDNVCKGQVCHIFLYVSYKAIRHSSIIEWLTQRIYICMYST
jgi:hypothetical protein